MRKGLAMTVVLVLLLLFFCASAAYAEGAFQIRQIDSEGCAITGYTGDAQDLVIPGQIDGLTVRVIDPYSFWNNNSIVSITIPDSVTEIGVRAFEWCGELQELHLGSSVKTIRSGAFGNCPKLMAVNEFPEGLERIEEEAFGGPLTEILLPDTVTYLAPNAFNLSGVGTFRWSAGVPVVHDNFFNGSAVRKVILPEGVTDIGVQGDEDTVYSLWDGSFQECRNLEEISIPSTLRWIRRYSFRYCSNLREIVLPEGITEIGSRTFESCDALERVVLPESLTLIEDNAFLYDSSLKSVEFPAGLENIGPYAFSGCESLQEIRLPENLRILGDCAFARCVSATALVLPEGLEKVPDACFTSCEQLTSVVIPDSVTEIGVRAFEWCGELQELHLGSSVKTIRSGAFGNCPKLMAVNEFPEGLERIEEEAFGGPLTEILLPDTVTYLAPNAFNLSGVGTFRWSAGVPVVHDNFFNGSAVRKVILPEGVTAIGVQGDENSVYSLWDGSFQECRNLEEISIPSTLRWIRRYSFRYCSNLREIVLPEGITEIGSRTFESCDALERVVLPESLTLIEDNAFLYDSSLKSVEFPAGLENIGPYAFSGCESLQEIRLPKNLRTLGEGAFLRCLSVTTLALPEVLEKVPVACFAECGQLTSVVIPDSVTEIDVRAFERCGELKELHLGSGVKAIRNGAFGGCGQLTNINEFPYGLERIGEEAFGGPLTEILLPDSVISLGNNAFNLSNIRTFRWSSGVEIIPDNAFYATPLEHIIIPEGVVAIGNYRDIDAETNEIGYGFHTCGVFSHCDNLTEIRLPSTVTWISPGTFHDSRRLQSFTVPDGVTGIGTHTFTNGYGLGIVTIPEGVSYIHDRAFEGAENVVLRVHQGSYAEQYAIRHQMDYIYELGSSNALRVNLYGVGPMESYAGVRLRLLKQGESFGLITLNGKRSFYEFTNIDLRERYTVVLETAQGDELARSEELTADGKLTECSIYIPKRMVQPTLRVLNASGQDLTERVNAKWYADGEALASGKTLPPQPEGKKVTVSVTLSPALLSLYEAPAEQSFIIAADQETLTVTLTSFPRVKVKGSVKNRLDGEAITGAVISVEQPVDGDTVYRTQTKSDNQGAYELDLPERPYTLTVKKPGFQDFVGVPADGSIALEPLEAVNFLLDLKALIAAEGESAENTVDMDDLQIVVHDLTTGNGRRTVLDYPKVILPQCSAGDRVRVALSSAGGHFAPVEAEFSLTAGQPQSLIASLIQYGGVRLSFGNRNPAAFVALYDSEGKYVASRQGKGEVSFSELKDGDYTAMLIGYSSAFRPAPSLPLMAEMGLAEHTDYILQGFRVSAGRITTAAAAETVPLLRDENRIYIANSSVYANRESMMIGTSLTLRASAELAEDYAGDMQDLAWVVSLPEGLHYLSGTAVLGRNPVALSVNGEGLYEVAVENTGDVLRLCVSPEKAGSYEMNVFLRFTYGGRTMLQPVGSAKVEATGLSLTVPKSVNTAVFPVRGFAPADSMVYVYEDSSLVGQTKTRANGEWSAEITLEKNSLTGYHRLHIEAVSALDPDMVLRSATRLVYYSPNGVTLESVTMINTAHPADSLTPQEYETQFDYGVVGKTISYYRYWPAYPEFTFIIRFTDNDPERVTAVRLNVLLSDGTNTTGPAAYSEAHKAWVVKKSFPDPFALPVQIGLSYIADRGSEETSQDWNVEATDAEFDTYFSEDGNEVTYTIDNDAIGELASTTIRVDDITEEEWKELQTQYLYRVVRTSNGVDCYTREAGEDTWETVAVGSHGVTRITERYSAAMYDKFPAVLSSPEFQSLAQELDQTLDKHDDLAAKRLRGDGECPAETDAADALRNHYDSVKDALYDAFLNLDLDAVKNNAELGLELKNLVDNLNSLNSGDIDFKPGFDLDNFLDFLKSVQSFERQYRRVGNSNLSDQQKLYVNTMGSIGVICSVGVSVGVGYLETYINTGMNLALIDNGAKAAWLGLRLNYVGSEAEREEIMRAIARNRDNYYDKLDNFDKYIGRYLEQLKDLPERFFGFAKDVDDRLGSGNANRCDPIPDSDKKTPAQDPSGVVYEAVPGNVLQGVTATCIERVTAYDLYGEPYTYEREWDAEEYGQMNPQLTDENGAYGWDVPGGFWRVRFEKEGYETAYSDWMEVPPPRFEVNIGLVSHEAPEVSDARVYADRIELSFSKYMRAEEIGADMALVRADSTIINGSWVWLDIQPDPEAPERELSRNLRFIPDEPIASDARVWVQLTSSLLSYAGTALQEEYAQVFSVIPAIEALTADEALELDCGEAGQITIRTFPATRAAGMRVQVIPVSGQILETAGDYVTLNAEGSAVINLFGKTPGTTECRLLLENTELNASVRVTVAMPEPQVLQVKAPMASVDSGAVPYGTKIELISVTPNARIYYYPSYPDGTAGEKSLYTGPIPVTREQTLYVTAEKAGMDASETIVFSYTLESRPLLEREYNLLWVDGLPASRSAERLELPDMEGMDLTWNSANESVASAADGYLILRGSGEAFIEAADNGTPVASYTLHVSAAENTLRLPANTQVIEDEAFSALPHIQALLLPDGLRQIGRGAFKGCSSLRLVYIPQSVEAIGTDALEGCDPSLRIIGYAGSVAERYAAFHGVPFLPAAE